MSENEPGQLGNREIITVCIAVSLAVIMVASLMPAMLPGGGGDTTLYKTVEVEYTSEPGGYSTTRTVDYVIRDSTGAEVERHSTGIWPAEYDYGNTYSFAKDPSTLSFTAIQGGEEPTTITAIVHINDDVKVYISWDNYQTVTNGSELANALQGFSAYFPNVDLTATDALWGAYTAPNVYFPGEVFDPSTAVPDEGGDTPSGGSDSTTAIVMAIIAIIFLGIALTALRTVLPGRGVRE